MEFSKFWLMISGLGTIVLIVLNAIGWVSIEIVLAGFAELSVCTGFYFWKSRNENRSKYAQKFVRLFAKEYDIDVALRIAEIVLRE